MAEEVKYLRETERLVEERSPTFDVLITTYKRPLLVKAAILSCLNQGPLLKKIIVVDDASGDETPDVVRAIGDPRIVFHQREKNGGIAAARRDAYSLSDADWTVVLDSDCELLPDAIEKYNKLRLLSPETVTMLAGRVQWDTGELLPKMLPNGIVDYETRIRWTCKKDGIATDYACAISKKIYKIIQREPLRSSFPDILFQLDVAKLGKTIFTPEPLLYEKSCVVESWTRGTAVQRFTRRMNDADDAIQCIHLLLERHKEGLSRWGKSLLSDIYEQAVFYSVLTGKRWNALGFFLKRLLLGRVKYGLFVSAFLLVLPFAAIRKLYTWRG
jgi:glycosyltransferase involved in cell wall biosynthesis